MLDVQAIGSVSIIRVPHSLQGECLAQCRETLGDCLSRRRSMIVLELSECPLINSQGLEFIIDSQAECLAGGGKLVVASPQPLCAEVLYITGVEDGVAVFPNLRMALGDFAR